MMRGISRSVYDCGFGNTNYFVFRCQQQSEGGSRKLQIISENIGSTRSIRVSPNVHSSMPLPHNFTRQSLDCLNTFCWIIQRGDKTPYAEPRFCFAPDPSSSRDLPLSAEEREMTQQAHIWAKGETTPTHEC